MVGGGGVGYFAEYSECKLLAFAGTLWELEVKRNGFVVVFLLLNILLGFAKNGSLSLNLGSTVSYTLICCYGSVSDLLVQNYSIL